MATSAPSYRWVCHQCGLPNDPGIDSCVHCGFSATARGIDISVASAKDRSSAIQRAATIKAACPSCKAAVDVSLRYMRSGAFLCPSCGAMLRANHSLIFLAGLLLWVPMVFVSYHYWPTFTFLGGDFLWLVAVMVALAPFGKIAVDQ